MKFCVKLNKNAKETYKKLKWAYGEHALSMVQFLGGIKHFWMSVRVWNMNFILEDLARQKWTKMRPKWGLSWGLIEAWQSEWWVVSWIWITELSTTFRPMNWACRKFVQSWFLKTSPTNKRKTKGMCAWTFLDTLKMMKIFPNMLWQVVNHGFSSTILKPNKVWSSTWATHRAWSK